MSGKTMLGVLVTGLVLFLFGFIYWAVNPLPYQVWNDVADPAAAQAAMSETFPEDGIYFIPGQPNDPAAAELMKTGPAGFVIMDHAPAAGVDPVALGVGLLHNIFSAALMVWVLLGISGLVNRITRALIIGLVATFVINGSEMIWWWQPFEWQIHQIIYYLIYFGLAALVLHRFVPEPETA